MELYESFVCDSYCALTVQDISGHNVMSIKSVYQ